MKAWDANCPKHIPQRVDMADLADAIAQKDRRIAALESELQVLRKKLYE